VGEEFDEDPRKIRPPVASISIFERPRLNEAIPGSNNNFFWWFESCDAGISTKSARSLFDGVVLPIVKWNCGWVDGQSALLFFGMLHITPLDEPVTTQLLSAVLYWMLTSWATA